MKPKYKGESPNRPLLLDGEGSNTKVLQVSKHTCHSLHIKYGPKDGVWCIPLIFPIKSSFEL